MAGLIRNCGLWTVFALCACTAEADKPDSHLDCAALISAASHLARSGQLKSDSEFERQALASSMTHLNAYAIRKGLREAEAFGQLKARRVELINATSSSAILERALVCIRNTPGQ